MASFTDKTPRFNPYIQQQPVEAMVAVGTHKQKAYEEGVQKIQTQIDNIGGLDVGRDVDKAYLQSKINELGNNLRTVASGDFSNFQLVNHTGGMIKQIEKDPYITSAVYSTANDRKQAAMMEEDRKKGTLTPQAEYYYGLKRNQYYSNPELKDKEGRPVSFSGKYIQSWDLDKNVLDAVKAVGDSKWTVDKVFKTDSLGNPLKDRNGVPIISEYAKREIRQGKFNENILAAIDSVLIKPEAKQELNMRGVYNYRGYQNMDDFVRGYEKEKEAGIQLLESRRIDVMSKVANETDPRRKEQLISLVNKIDGEIASVDDKEDLKIADAKQFSSLDAYKSALQTRETRNSYLKAYVTETISDEIIRSIPYDVAQDKIKADRDWYKTQQDVAFKSAEANLNERKFGFEQKKWSEHKDNTKNIPTMPLGGDLTTAPVDEHALMADFINKGEELSNTFSTGKRDFVIDYLQTLDAYSNKETTREEMARKVDGWSRKDPSWLDKYYEKSKLDVNNAKGSKYANLKTKLPVMQDLETQITTHANRSSDMDNHPNVIAAGNKEVDLANVGKGFKPFTINYEGNDPGLLFGGNRGLFQPQPKYTKTVAAADIVNAGLVSSYSMLRHTPTQKALYEKAKAALEQKFEVPADKVLSTLGLAPSSPALGFGSATITRLPNQESINNIVRKVGSQKFSDVLRAKEQVLKERTLGNQPLSLSVYPSNIKSTERASVDDRLKNVLGTFQAGGIDVSDFNSIYVGSKKEGFNATIGIDRGSPSNPADTYNLELYDGATKIKQVPLTKQQVDYIRGEQVKLPTRVSDVQEKIQWSGDKGTTNSITGNLNSPSAPRGAHYKQDFFRKNFNRNDIKGADIKVNGMGEYNLYFYVENKEGNTEAIPIKMKQGDEYPASFTSADNADVFMRQQLTTQGQVDNIINNSK
jgi:hypothetical protein